MNTESRMGPTLLVRAPCIQSDKHSSVYHITCFLRFSLRNSMFKTTGESKQRSLAASFCTQVFFSTGKQCDIKMP